MERSVKSAPLASYQKISNELKLKNLVQGNIVIQKHCDAIKGMATGVLQEAMTQICRWGWLFPM